MGSNPAFVFVFPSVLNGRVFDGFDYHLGTGYLRAYLAAHGVDSAQFLGDANKSVSDVVADILVLGGKMVGFSCYDANYHIVRLLAEEIRRQAPSLPIVVGGPSATFSDLLILSDCAAFDICCRSYAEEIALDLVRWRRGEIELESIGGVTYRRGVEIIRNGERSDAPKARISTAVRDTADEAGTFWDTGGALDVYPDPYVGGYLPPHRVSDIGLVTSRGCTYACTFCNFSAMSGWGVATHSIGRQIEVFRFLESCLAGRDRKTLVTINDDNFSLQGKRFHELIRRMSAASFQNLEFWAEMRTEPLKDDTFGLLREAGFAEINFGLESAAPHVLAAMKKVRSTGWERDDFEKERRYLERIAWAVRRARSEGVRTTVSVIFGGPLETPADGRCTLDFIKTIQVDSYAHNFMIVGDGTELATNYATFGLSTYNPPDRVLPPVTRTAYDVYQLPILDHDRSWLPMSGLEMRQASLLFSGTGYIPAQRSRPRGNGRGGSGRATETQPASATGAGPVVSLPETALDAHVAEWMARVLPMNLSVWLTYSDPGVKARAQTILNRAKVPVPEVNTLRNAPGPVDTVVYRVSEFSSEAPEMNTRHISCVPLSSAAVGGTFRQTQVPRRSSLILEIETPEDISALLSLAPSNGANGAWTVGADMVASRALSRDACRWCSSGCPAARLERLIVDEQRWLRTCHSGSPIGRVGEALPELFANAARISEAVHLERGCAACPVSDSCAKCLFTGPLTAAEYCHVQTSKPGLRGLFDGLIGLQSLHDSDLIDGDHGEIRIYSLLNLEGTITGGIEAVPLARCVMMVPDAGDLAFLYSHSDALLMTLSYEDAIALGTLLTPPILDEAEWRRRQRDGAGLVRQSTRPREADLHR
jgi:radical SAM superfamily enzyme YgiQ (UPF0313 family)